LVEWVSRGAGASLLTTLRAERPAGSLLIGRLGHLFRRLGHPPSAARVVDRHGRSGASQRQSARAARRRSPSAPPRCSPRAWSPQSHGPSYKLGGVLLGASGSNHTVCRRSTIQFAVESARLGVPDRRLRQNTELHKKPRLTCIVRRQGVWWEWKQIRETRTMRVEGRERERIWVWCLFKRPKRWRRETRWLLYGSGGAQRFKCLGAPTPSPVGA